MCEISTDYLKSIYLDEECCCSESLFRAPLKARGIEPPMESRLMLSGFSGGVSIEDFCGALIGGVAAIGYLVNKDDDESFELSKEITVEFTEACKAFFGTYNCHEIKTVYRNEEIRCYDAVKEIYRILEETLRKRGI
ncbi:MAG: C-GCAxxG-C-C family (seleno)protein [Clostridia bacterium]|nr:C-GCAxxG-C-C family (seleno)protein [Clostridia bacterium]